MKNNDPTFWPGTDIDQMFTQQMNRNYSDSINILQSQWYQADLDERFVLGDQDLWGLLFPQVASFSRKMFNFNMINSMVQVVSGYQRKNRKATICVPTQQHTGS